MKPILLSVLFFVSQIVSAQNEEKIEMPDKESEAYHEYRYKLTFPPYSLNKIQGLIAKIKADNDDHESLKSSIYNALTLREKFTYHMIHGESYSQICDAFPPIMEENKKIFAYIPDAFGEYNWSERQKDFLNSYRDSVMILITESIKRTKRIGANYKQAIIEINAKEMIPLLINTYSIAKKDLDILTLLMQLMKDNKYGPFVNSPSYKKLYSDTSDYMSYIKYNKENEALIIKRASDFYNDGKK